MIIKKTKVNNKWTKKTIGLFLALIIASTVGVKSTSALTIQDIELLIGLGIIPADKAEVAKAAVSSSSTNSNCGLFSRNLTLGSTGSDVVALQNFLETKNFMTIPTGISKGYFGSLTQSALAKYQASVGISPAAGYFGPITRAKVSDDCSTTGSTGSTNSQSPTLSGDEANLEGYDSLSKYSNEDLEEGETAKVFAAEFDVEDGDVRIERIDVRVEAVDETKEDKPWRQIEEITLYINGKKVDDIKVDDEDEWSRKDSTVSPSSSRSHEVRFGGLNTIVKKDDTAEIELEVTASDRIDDSKLDQSWRIWIPTEGIRAIDGKGIDQYTGSNSETKDFTIEAAQNGDVTIRESDDDLDESILIVANDKKKGPYEVFRFEIDNDDSADILLNTLAIAALTSDSDITTVLSDVIVEIDGDEFRYDTASTSGSIGEYTFDFEDNNDEITIEKGDTVEVVVKAEFLKLSGNYTDGTTIQFGVGKLNGSNYGPVAITAEGEATGDDSYVSGRQEGSEHTLRREGIIVEGIGKPTAVITNTNSGASNNIQKGVFEIEVEITALEEDAYIQDGVATSASTGSGFVVSVTDNGTTFVGTTTAYIAKESAKTETANRHKISAGTSETFTIRVELDPVDVASGKPFGISIDQVRFASSSDTTLVNYIVPDRSEFETNKITIY